jgi:hypothetical protein
MASDQGALLLRRQLKGIAVVFLILSLIHSFFLSFLYFFISLFLSFSPFFLFSWIELLKNPVDGFSAGLVDEQNIYEWDILIIGPTDTP